MLNKVVFLLVFLTVFNNLFLCKMTKIDDSIDNSSKDTQKFNCDLKSDEKKEVIKGTFVLLFGPPGAGKGTLAQTCKNLGLEIINGGDLVRIRAQQEDSLGLSMRKALDAGCTVPNEIAQEVIYKELLEAVKRSGDQLDKQGSPGSFALSKGLRPIDNLEFGATRVVVLDGFPRNVGQVENFLVWLKSNNLDFCLKVFCLDVSRDLLLNRLAKRQSCPACFYVQAEGENCKRCLNLTFQRAEDKTEETIVRRIKTFNDNKELVLGLIKELGLDFFQLTVTDQMTCEQVFGEFLKFLNPKN